MNIIINTIAGQTTAKLICGEDYNCTIGRNSIINEADKREGDGATPLGSYPIRYVYYRPDRVELPQTELKTIALTPEMGWCDESRHEKYNQPVTLPFAASHEGLWREDHVYDYIIVLGHNDNPPVEDMGSAIFMHLKHADDRPTAGCIALSPDDMRAVLSRLGADSTVTIQLG